MGTDGQAVLTLPPGLAEAEVRDFLARHREWLRRAQTRMPEPMAVRAGLALPVDGVPVALDVHAGRTRLEGDRLLLQAGQPEGRRAAAWLKARARRRLAPLAEAAAARLGRQVTAIALKDTRSRWGSCSTLGRLNFSWRIAMAPPEVQAYLAAHEAAHLVEMNHSPRYWAVLAQLMPDFERPRAWLKREGRTLHRYRFE